MTREAIAGLTTHLSSNKGYSKESPAAEGMHGFVCPRADSFGGREGIISPGVAVQHGLVPRGMKRVAVSEVAASANKAAESGKTEIDQYREYYEANADKVQRQIESMVGASPGGPAVAVAETSAKPPVQVHPETPGPQRMFSDGNAEPAAEDTLDDFYAGLGGTGYGTDESGLERLKHGGGAAAGVDRAARPAESVVATVKVSESGAMDVVDVRRHAVADPGTMALERQVSLLKEKAALEAASIARHDKELRDRIAELEAEVVSLQSAVSAAMTGETVRVILSSPEVKIKLGGEHWECRVMGALHRSHTGSTVVLTVSDSGYAAELLSEIRSGRVVILTEDGRTSCTYSGICAKLYGDSASPDFITCFRFSGATYGAEAERR